MFSKFIFLVSESFRGLYRTKVPAVISSITIAISLVILSVAIVAYYNFIAFSKNIKAEFEISTFFEQDISLEEANELYFQIFFIDGIEQGEFIDKQKAAEIYKELFNKNVEEEVGENPLPYSANYKISENFRDLENTKLIESKIKKINGVEGVEFSRATIKKINDIIEIILSIVSFQVIFSSVE